MWDLMMPLCFAAAVDHATFRRSPSVLLVYCALDRSVVGWRFGSVRLSRAGTGHSYSPAGSLKRWEWRLHVKSWSGRHEAATQNPLRFQSLWRWPPQSRCIFGQAPPCNHGMPSHRKPKSETPHIIQHTACITSKGTQAKQSRSKQSIGVFVGCRALL